MGGGGSREPTLDRAGTNRTNQERGWSSD